MNKKELRNNIVCSLTTMRVLTSIGQIKSPKELVEPRYMSATLSNVLMFLEYNPELFSQVAENDEKLFTLISQKQREINRETQELADKFLQLITQEYPSLIKE